MLRWRTPCLLVAIAIVAVLLAGCGGDDDAATGDGATIAPPTDSAGTDATSRPAPSPGDIPTDFPEDFPVYPGSTLNRVSDFGSRFFIGWTTAGPVEEVKQFFQQELNSGGWIIESTEDNGEGQPAIVQFTGGDDSQYSGQVAVTSFNETETTVLVDLTLAE